MSRVYEIPPPAYDPPISQEEADAIRAQQIEAAELRAAEKLLDPLGRELADPTPMAPPVGYNPQPTLVDQMRAMIMGERMRIAAEEAGMETFEEADDFEMDEDPFPRSRHEDEFDAPTPARELRKREREAAAAASSTPKPDLVTPAAGGGAGGSTNEAPVGAKSGGEAARSTPSQPPQNPLS